MNSYVSNAEKRFKTLILKRLNKSVATVTKIRSSNDLHSSQGKGKYPLEVNCTLITVIAWCDF